MIAFVFERVQRIFNYFVEYGRELSISAQAHVKCLNGALCCTCGFSKNSILLHFVFVLHSMRRLYAFVHRSAHDTNAMRQRRWQRWRTVVWSFSIRQRQQHYRQHIVVDTGMDSTEWSGLNVSSSSLSRSVVVHAHETQKWHAYFAHASLGERWTSKSARASCKLATWFCDY